MGNASVNVYVLPDFLDGWLVCRAGETVSRHDTQAQAIVAGRRLARRHRVELVTWGVDGQIRSKDSYGNEGPARDNEH